MDITVKTTMFAKSVRMASLVVLFSACFLDTPASAEIAWQRNTNQVIRSARRTRKPILVFVTAKWCHFCNKMKDETWANPAVSQPVAATFETLVLDADRDKEAVSSFGLKSFPATLMFTADGQYVGQSSGFMSSAKTMAWLRETLGRISR